MKSEKDNFKSCIQQLNTNQGDLTMKKKPIFSALYKYDDDDVYHIDLEHDTLQDVASEVIQELFPKCDIETFVHSGVMTVNYRDEEDDDDEGEFEIPYNLKAIQKWIDDIIDFNETGYSEIVIKKSFLNS